VITEADVSAAVVILAAGSSSRMAGIKKEYQKLNNGDTVLCSSVRAFSKVPFIKTIVIVVQKDGEAFARDILPQELLSSSRPKITFVTGGECRRASAYNALAFLKAEMPCYVLIHDGARPFVSASLIENIIKTVIKHDAVIPVMPITETPKELDFSAGDGFIKRHLKRSEVGVAQTPQGFKFPEILHAHEKADKESEEFTDDAEIWGKFCGKVAVIPGEAENKKITFKEDLC